MRSLINCIRSVYIRNTFIPLCSVLPRVGYARLRHCYSTLNVPSTPIDVSKSSLRPYQSECVEAIMDALERKTRPAVSLPTGSGKTRIFSSIIKQVKCMYNEDASFRSKVLIIVNRTELVDQAINSIQNTAPDLSVGRIYQNISPDPEDQVIVATYQTLSNSNRINALNPAEFKMIIIDEAHHSASASYEYILEYFDAITPKPEASETEVNEQTFESRLARAEAKSGDDGDGIVFDIEEEEDSEEVIREDNPNRRVHVLGFSATFWRHDKKLLGNIYDEICYHENMESMVKGGYLCPGRLSSIKVDPNTLKDFIDVRGNLKTSNFFTSKEGIDLIYNTWASNPERKHTIIFGTSLSHLSELNNKFAAMGVDSAIIHSQMKKKDRSRLLNDFAAGKFPVLLNCQILTEGTDIPIIDQVILARGVKSTGLFVQMVGRGFRLHPSKKDCNVVVFLPFHTLNGSFIPQLFREVQYKYSNGEPYEPINYPKKKIAQNIDYTKLFLNDEGEFSFDKISDSNYNPKSPEESIFHWIKVNKNYYLFPLRENFYYKLSQSNGLWASKKVYMMKNFKKGLEVIKTPRLEETLKVTDMLVKDSKFRRTMLKKSEWRKKEPTQKQRDTKKIKDLNDAEMNRGTISDLVSLMVLGVKLTPEVIQYVKELN